MPTRSDLAAIAKVRLAARPVRAVADYDPLLQRIGEARFVLIGEASHGTHEFYQQRAEITKRLILERGFHAIAAEAGWPDAYRVNRYVRGIGGDTSAEQALGDFKRFPAWMWRNTVVLDFVEWLRAHNAALPSGATRVGFYGLDLYSMYTSIEAVIKHLDRVDPIAAKRARQRYSCFEHYGRDTEAYGWATSFGLAEPCEDEVVKQLTELQRHAAEYAQPGGQLAADEAFYAQENARLVKNAEKYYRAMFRGGEDSWNLRDRHMAGTLDDLAGHLSAQVGRSKVVVWEHNSHLGDARATQMGKLGELNVGQLVRERYGSDAFLVGQTTYAGTVTAASEWGGPAAQKGVRPSLPGSYELLFHDAAVERFLLIPEGDPVREALLPPRLERAIGVVYLPETERASHYFYARLPEQFDAVIHIDETRALEPLERTSEWGKGEVPETYPFAV